MRTTLRRTDPVVRHAGSVIIVAGTLHVAPVDRDHYLRAVRDVANQARQFPGCLDFSQSPDPNDSSRINVFELWESDDSLLAFRNAGTSDVAPDVPQILTVNITKYQASAVAEP